MKYNIIYADPGWQYGSKGPRSGRFEKLDYTTMPTKDICALNVESIAAEDCALFMWVTGSFMPDAMQVAKAWGFEFVRVDKVWAKKKPSGKPHAACGPWGMSDAEFIVLFVRGSMCSKQVGKRNQYVVVEAPYTGKHSEKPAIFRDMIAERFSPELRKIELFARAKAKGWDCWGNEVEDGIEITSRESRPQENTRAGRGAHAGVPGARPPEKTAKRAQADAG